MVIDELVLNGAIEALDMGVHFGGAGISVPVGDLFARHQAGEMLGELPAVVGQHDVQGAGEEGLGQMPDGTGDLAVACWRCQGEGKAAMGIGQGDQITP